MDKIKFTTTIDKDILQQSKIRAIEEGRPLNIIIEELLKQYISKDENK